MKITLQFQRNYVNLKNDFADRKEDTENHEQNRTHRRSSRERRSDQEGYRAGSERCYRSITASLVKGEKVQISGFGTFETKDREARIGRNPHTKEAIDIPATRVPTFKASKALKDNIAK